MGLPRTRIMTAGVHTGRWYNQFTGTSGMEDLYLGDSICEDTVEVSKARPDHGLEIIRRAILTPGTVRSTGSSGVYIWDAIPHGSQTFRGHIPLSSVPPTDIEAATKAAARTNPGRPSVSLPVFLAELRDLPGLIYKDGLEKISKPRNSVAENNFAWESLFRDVGTLFKVTKLFDERFKELRALHSRSGLKRKKIIWRASSIQESSPLVIWSLEGFAEATVRSRRESVLWASARWRPAVAGVPPSADRMLSSARKAVLGWRIAPADAWELMPWSWFIDYFFNVGEFLEVYANNSEYKLESTCVMQHDRTEHRFELTNVAGPIAVTPGVQIYETKVRRLGTIGLTATQPILSAKQVTTLAGIAANR